MGYESWVHFWEIGLLGWPTRLLGGFQIQDFGFIRWVASSFFDPYAWGLSLGLFFLGVGSAAPPSLLRGFAHVRALTKCYFSIWAYTLLFTVSK